MTAPISNDISYEREAVTAVLLEGIKEQRRARRWRIFFRFVFLLLFITFILALLPKHSSEYYNHNKPHTALIHINGEIADKGSANAEDINQSLDDAFENPNAKAVLLQINSPGGSPVQSGEVYTHIQYLQKKHPDIKIYAVCTDVCASGAYYIAAAANEIYADQASLVGSIGVLMNGFGFVDTLQKVGVQRRLMTAGSEKAFLDPFSPLKPQDQQHMQIMLDTIHHQFIKAVQKGRGNRLKQDPNLFSGLTWTGEQALPLGLIDGIATPEEVARNIIKQETLVDYSPTENVFRNFAKNIGTSAGTSAASSMGLKQGLLQ